MCVCVCDSVVAISGRVTHHTVTIFHTRWSRAGAVWETYANCARGRQKRVSLPCRGHCGTAVAGSPAWAGLGS